MMARSGDKLRADRVRELAEGKFTQAGLAAAVTRAGGKLSQQQATAILKGDVGRPGCLPELARVLHTTADYLLGKTDNSARPMSADMHDETTQKSQLPGFVPGSSIPVWHGVPSGGVMGEVILREKIVDSIPRHPRLAGATDALAFVILDELMDPAFRRGDIAYVNPTRPAVDKEDCLLVRQTAEVPIREYVTLPRYLVSSTLTHWLVRQFNPYEQYELSKADWPEAWKIQGKYSR